VAGPTFAFLYLPSAVPTLAVLARALHGLGLTVRAAAGGELALSGAGLGSLFVGVAPTPRFVGVSMAEREALVSALGDVPSHEICGYAMAKGARDWEALRRIAERVAERFGGLVCVEEAPRGIEGVVTAEHRDLEGFFGAMLVDTAYVRAHAHLVPVLRRHFVPARAVARASVLG